MGRTIAACTVRSLSIRRDHVRHSVRIKTSISSAIEAESRIRSETATMVTSLKSIALSLLLSVTASPRGDSTLADGELARAMRTRLRQRLELETSDEDMARVLDTSKL